MTRFGKMPRPPGRALLRRGLLVALLLVALLRPGLPGGSVQAAARDLNVFFVVDSTTSMVAEDHGDGLPRMQGARQDMMAIAEELPGARFAVITFDTKGHVRMPLTTDTMALETITSVLEPQVTAYAKGSSITAARQVLAERLAAARDSHPERPRLVFYLGDGEQTSARGPEPLELAGGLVDGGAVLGYGTAAGGRMKENTGLKPRGDAAAGEGGSTPYVRDGDRDALSVIDEGRLRGVASQLGVPYVHRSAGDAVDAMMQQARPGTLERRHDAGSLTVQAELYWLFAAAAFGLALVEAVMLVRRFRELPPAPAPVPGAAGLSGHPASRTDTASGSARSVVP